MNITARLAVEQVATEILQAVRRGDHDLTMARDDDTINLLQIMQDDQEKAERLVGQAFKQRLQQVAEGTAEAR